MSTVVFGCALVAGGCGSVSSGADASASNADAPVGGADSMVATPDAANVDAALPCTGLARANLSPGANAIDVPRTSSLTVTYSCAVNAATVNASSFVVSSSRHGEYAGQFVLNDPREVTFTPSSGTMFKPGELVEATLTGAVESTNGMTAAGPLVWQFRVATAVSTATLTGNTALPGTLSLNVTVGDIDGDGDLDSLAASGDGIEVGINNGSASFSAGTTFGMGAMGGVALADMDGDGDLDAVTAGFPGQLQIWANNGTGGFTALGPAFGANSQAFGIGLGDLDGDGDVDIYLATYDPLAADEVWLNGGNGTMVANGQTLSMLRSTGITLGDVDGDGDLDAVVARDFDDANELLLNDGNGQFSASGSAFGIVPSGEVSLGDVDGDGDLDAVVVSYSGTSAVYLNNGSGLFTASGFVFPDSGARGITLVDLDGDGDLDAYVANGGPDTLWLNNGTGTFTDTGQALGTNFSIRAAIGDLDGDGDLDALSGSNSTAPSLFLNN